MRQRSKTPSRLAVSDAEKYRFGRCYRQWKAAFKKANGYCKVLRRGKVRDTQRRGVS